MRENRGREKKKKKQKNKKKKKNCWYLKNKDVRLKDKRALRIY